MQKSVSVYGKDGNLLAYATGDVDVMLDSDEGSLIVDDGKSTTTMNWAHIIGYVEILLPPEGNLNG